jgi:hypothetical protein
MYLTAAPLRGMRDRPLRHICWSMWFAELDEHFELLMRKVMLYCYCSIYEGRST